MAKSLSKIMGSFTQAKNELRELIDKNTAEVDRKVSKAERLSTEASCLQVESHQAAAIIENIDSFIGAPS